MFVGQNPLEGTYRRYNDGDYRCPPDLVARMLADQSEQPADSRILPGFSVDDIDPESPRQYRNRFSARSPHHAWLSEDTIGFLRKLGAWNRNRETGEEGLTVAGLLIFGNKAALSNAVAWLKYHVDYRERPTNTIADRWTDRITMDGTWAPNLFQFFQKIYPKLTADLKLPFAYLPATSTTTTPAPFADPVRTAQSPVHEAIQEALVNSLIHADYRGDGGVVIERFTDRIELSNPGTLLVSIEQLREGAVSECRNPGLQRMFQLIGAGDKAGSGIDKIRRGWVSQQWHSPTVSETIQPDRVKFVLPLVSLLPPESETRLRTLFASDYDTFSPIEVQALVTADPEGEVSNGRLQLIRMEHPVELTKVLQGLASRGFLDQIHQKVTVHHNHCRHGPHTDSICVCLQPRFCGGRVMGTASDGVKGRKREERLWRYADSQLTVGEFCDWEGASVAAFSVWRKKLGGGQRGRRSTGSSATAEGASGSIGPLSRESFLLVRVAARSVATAGVPTPSVDHSVRTWRFSRRGAGNRGRKGMTRGTKVVVWALARTRASRHP